MDAYARKLFTVAAIFNFLVALGLLFGRPLVGPLFGLDPASGTNLVFLYLTGMFVALFGYSYLRIAQDPRRYRPFIELGIVGKLLAVCGATWPWLAGDVGWRIPFLAGGDLVFAVLFIQFLRLTAT